MHFAFSDSLQTFLLHSVELHIIGPTLISSCWPFIQGPLGPAFWTLLWYASHVFCCRNKGLEGTVEEGLDKRAAV